MSALYPEDHDRTPVEIVADGKTPLKVLVVDRRSLLRTCLVNYLKSIGGLDATGVSEIEVHAAATDSDGLPDIVLLCLGDSERLPASQAEALPESTGLRDVPIIAISSNRPATQVFEMLRGGIRGFIPTSVGVEVAVHVIRLVKAGGTFVPETCLHSLPDAGDATGKANPNFTHRQLQVVEAIRQGKPNKIIAYELNMCESTVKVHVRTIMKKLRARNRTQVAFLYATDLDKLAVPAQDALSWPTSIAAHVA